MKKRSLLKGYHFYLNNLVSILGYQQFMGWGRKRSGRFAVWCAKTFNGVFTLKEDGFLRSVGLGVEGAAAFSIVEDDLGIYYDATVPSRLEVILQSYDFAADSVLMQQAAVAMAFLLEHQLSKYNQAPEACDDWFAGDDAKKRVLVVVQTAGDESLKYGYGQVFSTLQMVQAALDENPGASVYLKIHPDVLAGIKYSDFNLADLPSSCRVLTQNVNPISLMRFFEKVYTKTSLMGFEALMAGKKVVCFGMPFYAGWGLTDDRVACERRQRSLSVAEVFAGAYILYSHYSHPDSGEGLNVLEAMQSLVWYRQQQHESETFDQAYFLGFTRWKHGWLGDFFPEIRSEQFVFINPILSEPLTLAKKKGLNAKSRLYLWGRSRFPTVEAYAQTQGIPIFRVEDGFIRSISLGSDLTRPYSLVVDSLGIYFDPNQPSDLERLLMTHDFDANPSLLEQTGQVIEEILHRKLSKYNCFIQSVMPTLPATQKIILVPGQVEDDASIQYGANGVGNLSLLQQVRKQNPDAYLIFKPHPDVVVGNRIGEVANDSAMNYCDLVVEKISLDALLPRVDEVHTLTSLVGFEALLRGKKVVTYGMPFYAGWGLTEDVLQHPRRGRRLSLVQLAAAVLLLYPRYISPKTRRPCSLDNLLVEFDEQLKLYQTQPWLRAKMNLRNLGVRWVHKAWRFLKKNGDKRD